MIDSFTRIDIEKISYDILKDSKCLDVFPTPVDKVVAYSELEIKNDVDISKVHENYLSKATDVLRKALGKVRGLFDRKEKIIYLDLSQIETRKNFVKLHEVGHGILPWQQSCYNVIDDDDETLSLETRDGFEAEANFFASVTLFQHDRFMAELSKYNLGIDSAIHMAKHFGASIHATLRRYVECSKKRCALLVLENISSQNNQPRCGLRNLFHSQKFIDTYGTLKFPLELGYTWSFVQEYYFKKRYVQDGSFTTLTENGRINFRYQFFNNSYNAFVLIYPKDEKRNSKTKFIITDKSIQI